MDLEPSFWEQVDKNGPVHLILGTRCWLWVGTKNKAGYGIFKLSKWIRVLAHRASWFVTYRKWPEPMALHRCDNPSCVRPDHLFEGTQKINVADMLAKGRGVFGRSRGRKLTAQDVTEIQQAAGTTKLADLALRYDVTLRHIWRIVHHKRRT